MSKSLLICILIVLAVSCQSNTDIEKNTIKATEIEVLSSVSKSENYAKQIILACTKDDLLELDSLVNWVVDFQPGGLWFKNWPIESIQELAIRLDTLVIIKPLFFTDYFSQIESEPYAIWGANKYFQDSMFWKGFLTAGINAILLPELAFKNRATHKYFQDAKAFEKLMPTFRLDFKNKNISDLKDMAISLQKTEAFLWFDDIKIDSLPYSQMRKGLNLKGLIIVNPASNHLSHLTAGADMVVISNRSFVKLEEYRQSQTSKMAYQTIKEHLEKPHYEFSGLLSSSALLKSTQLHFQAKSTVIFNNTKQSLPFRKFKKISLENFLNQQDSGKKQLVEIPKSTPDSTLVILSKLPNDKQTLFLFSNPNHYRYLENLPLLIFSRSTDLSKNSILNEQINGRVSINGSLMVENKVIKGKNNGGKGLSNLPPEFVFIDNNKLGSISALVHSAIDGKAFPGCQVFAIKDEVIIYNKAFGHTNYSRNLVLNQGHIFDLASLTKVLATTLVAMKLWEDGYFKLDDAIGKYLPDSLSNYLPNGSTLRHITFQELFTHQSGLPAGFPVIKYMRKAADLENRFSNGFCDYPYDDFQTEVAENLFLENSFQDSMWLTLNSLWLDPSKEYKYSDVNMNTLYFLLKRIIEKNKLAKNSQNGANLFETFLYDNFYTPLKMKTSRYHPLKQFSKNRIVPTENDRFWRKQLLQGHVHDPNAALYGGIAGNAGLFSSASDLGVLLYMWQHNGIFEGKRYLKAATIQKFSQAQQGSHRGLGFNKRTFTNAAYAMGTSADQASYGHTGFTGTCFWVDPVHKISYVFLSNRVHPKVSNKIYGYNIRTTVHQVFYDAMLK